MSLLKVMHVLQDAQNPEEKEFYIARCEVNWRTFILKQCKQQTAFWPIKVNAITFAKEKTGTRQENNKYMHIFS
jgi:hypothetical protein